jgi:hypothetical protein
MGSSENEGIHEGPTHLWRGSARLWRLLRRYAYGLGALGLLGAGLAYNSCYVWTPYGYVNQCGYGYGYGYGWY